MSSEKRLPQYEQCGLPSPVKRALGPARSVTGAEAEYPEVDNADEAAAAQLDEAAALEDVLGVAVVLAARLAMVA